MSIDKALQRLFKLSIDIKKVWENSSPDSSFKSQILKIQIPADCNFALVVSKYASGYNGGPVNIITRNRGLLAYPTTLNMFRVASIRNDGISFENGFLVSPYGTSGENNQRIIPQEIYTIRLIGGALHKIRTFLAALFNRGEVPECP